MASWWCSKCGDSAELKEGYAPIDPRYGIGHCEGKCRSEVQLVYGTQADTFALIAKREDRALLGKQMQELRVGLIPNHVRAPKCCDKEKVEHLSADRLAVVRGSMGMA